MDIAELRDLVIVVSGIVVTLAAIGVFVISYLAYRKIDRTLKSVRTAAARIEALSIIASDEIGRPLSQAAGLIQGIACQIRTMCNVFKKGA